MTKPLAAILCLTAAAAVATPPACAAGVDSRAYTCTGLQALIAQYRFIFLNNPDFQDFVVADQSECPAEGTLVWRTVPTQDRPECTVYWCGGAHTSGAQ